VIFGRRKSKSDDVHEEEEIEQVLFQGAMNGQEANLSKNAKLTEAALVPTKELVTDTLARRAEKLRIDVKGDRAAITMAIDGVAYSGGRMPKQQAMAITQMVKLLAGLDIKERSKAQKGGIKAEFQDTPYELHVQTVPMQGGVERLTINARNLKVKLDKPADLGFTEEFKDKIRKAGGKKQGLLLVCGPPESGTTTTTHVVLRTIDTYLYSMYSITDHEGRDLFGVTEFEHNEEDSLDDVFDKIIRAEADVVFAPKLDNAELAKTIMSKQNKVGIVCELKAQDAADGILQLIKLVGDAKTVANSLTGVISQKLIRLLCEPCKQAYRPNPKLLAKIGLPPETKVLYRPPSEPPPEAEDQPSVAELCHDCGGIPYYGRAGMYEMIEMTAEMQELVAKNPPAAEIRALARKQKMPSLQRDGLRLVAEGKTSLEELQRIFKSK